MQKIIKEEEEISLQVYHVYSVYLVKITVKAKDVCYIVLLHRMQNGAVAVIDTMVVLFPQLEGIIEILLAQIINVVHAIEQVNYLLPF